MPINRPLSHLLKIRLAHSRPTVIKGSRMKSKFTNTNNNIVAGVIAVQFGYLTTAEFATALDEGLFSSSVDVIDVILPNRRASLARVLVGTWR